MAFIQDAEDFENLRDVSDFNNNNELPLMHDDFTAEDLIGNVDNVPAVEENALNEGNGLFEDNDYPSYGYSPSRHDSPLSPPGADLVMDDALSDVSINTDTSEVTKLKRHARKAFGMDTCPPFQLSSHAHLPDFPFSMDLREYLDHSPRTLRMLESTHAYVDYDLIHFKTDTVDEVYTRQTLHYEIAQALHRQTVAEETIREHGVTVLYAVNDAQITLLINHLREKCNSYSIHYDPANTLTVESMVKDHATDEFTVQTHKELKHAYYMREITDEVVVRAFKSLTASCIMFCVGRKVPREVGEMEQAEVEKARQEAEAAEKARQEAEALQKQKEAEQAAADIAAGRKPAATKTKRTTRKKQPEPVDEVKDLRDPKDRDWKFRPYQACAFFEYRVDRHGELTFDTDVYYYDLPFDELPTQPPSLVRDEAYMEVRKATTG
ncbi:hypothetical protein PRZ48_005928 [Zasmidium cellare]|uniref:Uncharacterized protein n=1 Tax=Zasmidium cellare TaxID=395010 RepID=A0ABR0EMR2_ZASCE|nr:hypothetical protein PRZ48_005928 [Zasmidium cellare]